MNTRSRRRQALIGLAVVTAVTTLALASCSADSSSDDAAGTSDSGGGSDMGSSLAEAPADAEQRQVDSGAVTGENAVKPGSDVKLQLNQAVIKTGTIEMESDDVAGVVDQVYLLAAKTRGAVTGESTSTNDKGVTAHSMLELKVPVAAFTETVRTLKTYGTSPHAETQEVDVTGEVADVNSRVKSAEESIDQLRLLFTRATKLGDVITLERELSQREADLEALQAQQRSLQAQTTMSTITLSVSLVDDEQAPGKGDDDQAGFVAGIKQGWDGFVTFIVGTSHFLGLVLPLGTLALILGWVAWLVVRRVGPHPSGPAAGTPPAASTD